MKILFLATHEFMRERNNGGRLASYRNYTLLRKIYGPENVHLCMFSNDIRSDAPRNIRIFPKFTNRISQLCCTLAGSNQYRRRDEKDILHYIEELNPDLVFFDFSILGRLVNNLHTNAVTIVFLHNIERLYAWNKVRHGGLHYLPAYFSYKNSEKMIMRNVDKIICLNQRDARQVQNMYGRSADFLFPITFTDLYTERGVPQREKPGKMLLFVGSLFQPNYDGILWFIDNVMPRLQDFQLFIVGKDMERKRARLARGNVEVIGTAEDLSVWYRKADAMVLPVFYGDGMKVKTAEALMYGKTIFAAHEALEGYDAAGIDGIYECNTADEFADSLHTYFARADRCRVNPAVRELFMKKYETGVREKCFADFIDSCITKTENRHDE